MKRLKLVITAVVSSGLLLTGIFGLSRQPQPPAISPVVTADATAERGQETARRVFPVEPRPAPPPPSSEGGTTPESSEPPKVYQETVERNRVIIAKGREYPLRTYETQLTPNDPNASQDWVTAAKVSEAWDVAYGGYTPLLAIIDTGFALAHEEFSGRWHANAGESGVAASENASLLNCTARSLPITQSCNLIDDNFDGVVDNEIGTATYENPSQLNCSAQSRTLAKDCNLVDDDGNGLVDDWRGWDFINFDRSTQAGQTNASGAGTQHGTYVAGVAAATGNNSKGIAGVDWNAKILPIQALDDNGYGNTLSVARAIDYAVAQGADVISLSLGSTYDDPYVREAVQAAVAAGSIVVAASGNDGCECMVYPARYPEVVGVGALGTDGNPAYFSSWGANLDILAPGVSLYTTDWLSSNQTSAYDGGISGTSLATPIVSGLISRLISQRPEATPLQIIAAVTEKANRMTLADTTVRSNTLGYGKLDAGAAMARAVTPVATAHMYALSPVSLGDKINSSAPAEVIVSSGMRVYTAGAQCATPIFELSKSDRTIFSISAAESYQATQSGYTSALFGYGCVQLPHDTQTTVRNIDMFSEFKNSPGPKN